MDQGKFNMEARQTAVDLIDTVSAFEPRTEREQGLYAAQLGALCEFWNGRRTRIVTAGHGIPALEWVVLITGGVITILFTYFFKLEHLKIQVIMTALVATIISLCLYLVLMFGYPFSGDLKVDPSGFRVSQAIVAYEDGGSSPGLALGDRDQGVRSTRICSRTRRASSTCRLVWNWDEKTWRTTPALSIR